MGDAFLRVFVTTDGPVPGIADRIRDDLPNALDVHLVYERAEAEGRAGAPVSSLAPRDQFLAYYRSQHGADPDRATCSSRSTRSWPPRRESSSACARSGSP